MKIFYLEFFLVQVIDFGTRKFVFFSIFFSLGFFQLNEVKSSKTRIRRVFSIKKEKKCFAAFDNGDFLGDRSERWVLIKF